MPRRIFIRLFRAVNNGMSRSQQVVGVILFAFSIVAIFISVREGNQRESYVKCQAAINDALIKRSRVVLEFTDKETKAEHASDDAITALLLDPATLKPMIQRTPAERERILTKTKIYIDSLRALQIERRAVDEARKNNPLPPLPSQVC